MDEQLNKILKYDPIQAAEDFTGNGNHATMAVGFMLLQMHAEEKFNALKQRGDIHNRMSVSEYIEVISSIGFEEVYEEEFVSDNSKDAFYIYARRDGFIISFDTYYDKTVINSANLYYNWYPNDKKDAFKYVRSGGYHGDKTPEDRSVWSGSYDGREAVLNHISILQTKGQIVPKWIVRPHLWFVHYGDEENNKGNYPEYRNITGRKIEKLPQWVKDMIGQEDEV